MSAVEGNRLVFVRGEGCYVYDEDGKRYYDTPAGLWYANVGHGREEIATALADQARRLESYSSFGRFTTDITLDLADRIASLAPFEETKVLLTSGGSDGVDLAAKLARRYWSAVGRPEKTRIVSRNFAYHGLHAYGTSITGLVGNQEGLGSFVADTLTVPTHDILAVAELFEREGDTIAAFFTEPVMGTGGVHLPEPEYFARLNQLCREFDVLLVADEVITGFGRLGSWFGTTRVGLEPDLIITAKGISSGYVPIGALLVGPRVAEPFFGPGALPFRHGMTHSGHSIACAGAMANLDIIERENLIDRVRDLETVLSDLVLEMSDDEGVVEVRSGLGLMAGIQLESANLAERVSQRSLEAGFIARVITNGTLQISPPFVTTNTEIASVVSAFRESLASEVGRGVLVSAKK